MGFVFILIGVFAIVCTYGKFDFYWNSRKAKRMRNLIGDSATSVFYYAIGLASFVYGVLVVLNVFESTI